MDQSGGYTDIDISYKPAKPEYSGEIERDRAAMINIPVSMTGYTLRILQYNPKINTKPI